MILNKNYNHFNGVRKIYLKTRKDLVKNHKYWDMNLGERYEDYQRKKLIFKILIYYKTNIYKICEEMILLWHSRNSLYHLGTMHYDIVMRNQ